MRYHFLEKRTKPNGSKQGEDPREKGCSPCLCRFFKEKSRRLDVQSGYQVDIVGRGILLEVFWDNAYLLSADAGSRNIRKSRDSMCQNRGNMNGWHCFHFRKECGDIKKRQCVFA